jgi:hypothetical protein
MKFPKCKKLKEFWTSSDFLGNEFLAALSATYAMWKEAREVAEALTAQAFHNVAFFDGTYSQLISRPVVTRRW